MRWKMFPNIKSQKSLFKIISSVSLIIFISGCGNYEEFKEDPSTLFSRVAPSQGLTFSEIKSQVLTPKCIRCHPGYEDYQTVINNIDSIGAQVRSDRMPKDGPMGADLKGLLFSWIAAGTPQGDVIPVKPSPNDELVPNYESIAKNILGKKCIACHNPQGQVPFLDFSTRESIWKKRKLLFNFEKPESSYILEVIQDPVEPMPPINGPFEQLNQEEIDVLKEWIGLGLP
jgi:mono/diheme cytochrome c family protein